VKKVLQVPQQPAHVRRLRAGSGHEYVFVVRAFTLSIYTPKKKIRYSFYTSLHRIYEAFPYSYLLSNPKKPEKNTERFNMFLVS
jgi:hypothetical protein